MKRVQAACDITYGMLNPDVVEIDGADEERDNEIIIPKGTRGERAFIFGPEANDLVKFENGEQWYIDKAWFEPAPRLKETRTMSNPYPAPIRVRAMIEDYNDYGEFNVEGMYSTWDAEYEAATSDKEVYQSIDKWDEISRATAAKLERAYNFCDIDPVKLEDKRLSVLLEVALELATKVMGYAEAEAHTNNALDLPSEGHEQVYDEAEKFAFELREMLGLE